MPHTILRKISAVSVVNIEIRLPNLKPKRINVDGSRKRKQPQQKISVKRYCHRPLHVIPAEHDDQFPKMKGFYIVMDNAPIHTADDIDEMISKRRYRSIYLPPYSPELNPIENF